MNRVNLSLRALSLGALIVTGPAAWAQTDTETESEPEWNVFRVSEDISISLNGYFYLYNITNQNSYYTNSNAAFTELSAGLGMDIHFRDEFSSQLRVVGTGLYGEPEKYLGVSSSDMDMFMDLANVSWHTQLSGQDLKLTAGLQELMYGDGFLIMDGYSETRAIWTTPVRSFPAVKASLDLGQSLGEGSSIDVFASYVRDDFMSYEAYLETGAPSATGGSLTGMNWHLEDTSVGTVDVGVFYKDEKSSSVTDSDTLAISLRDEVSLDAMPVTLSGELVAQYGKTNVVAGVPGSDRVTREAWGGHLTCRWQILDEGLKPWVKGRFVYFGGDRSSSTNTSEAFDPMFFGWNDWGEWWIGDMTSFELPHSNAQSYVAEVGVTPTDSTSLRLLYVNSNLVKRDSFSSSRDWAHELNLVFDYTINDNLFAGVMGGAAIPRRAAKAFNGGAKVNYEAILWVGFSF